LCSCDLYLFLVNFNNKVIHENKLNTGADAVGRGKHFRWLRCCKCLLAGRHTDPVALASLSLAHWGNSCPCMAHCSLPPSPCTVVCHLFRHLRTRLSLFVSDELPKNEDLNENKNMYNWGTFRRSLLELWVQLICHWTQCTSLLLLLLDPLYGLFYSTRSSSSLRSR
jgi:hypothetical protein